MKVYVPDYYKDFECIKDKCKHSCCIGWEIDIDKDTLSYYKKVRGDFGKRLSENISDGDNPHFLLKKGDRCPFLNHSGLCDIYINLGREHLCEICSNHPRFVNVFSHREEWGLGMCCEAAAHIILNRTSPVHMVCDEEDNRAEEIISVRQDILGILQDRTKTVEERFENLFEKYDVDFPEYGFDYWRDVFLNLEILDHRWTEILNMDTVRDYEVIKSEEYQLSFEQLAVYFVLRYINKENEDNLRGWISFCYLGVYMTEQLFLRMENKDKETFEDLCRMYSSEIEYSLDNVDEIMFELA